MTSSLDSYWMVSLAPDADSEPTQCIVRVSTSDILRDLARGPGSLIRRHFHRDGDLAGYIADHLETVRRLIACEIVAPLFLSGLGCGGWKWREARQASGFEENSGPCGNIGDFPVWHRISVRQPQAPTAVRWRSARDSSMVHGGGMSALQAGRQHS